MIQLTRAEAKIYEAFRQCSTTKEASQIAGISINSVRVVTPDLVKLGLIRKSGGDKHHGYTYEHIDVEYEVVKERKGELALEPQFQRIVDSKLTTEQIKYLIANKDMPRSKLAKHFGITKTELMFAMGKINGK